MEEEAGIRKQLSIAAINSHFGKNSDITICCIGYLMELMVIQEPQGQL